MVDDAIVAAVEEEPFTRRNCGLRPGRERDVPHHVAHAASSYVVSPFSSDCAFRTREALAQVNSVRVPCDQRGRK